MSIGVQSYPELYTTLLGLRLYDKLWELLSQTGIVYIPFIGMILRNFSQSYVSHGGHAAGPSALRTMEINLIVTIFLILFAVMPCIPFDARTISYTPQCESNADKTYFPGDTGTTYDKAFSLPTESIKVPMWWYIVISVSEGMTNAANTMVSCVPNLRKMVTVVDFAKISDSEVKHELQDFETMCYLPARMQFNKDKENNIYTHINRVEADKKIYGITDTEWFGSHSFMDVYYQDLKASHAVPGFPYDASQDINADAREAGQPAYGTPSCSDWWNDDVKGLKNRVYQSLPKSFYDDFNNYLNNEKTHDDVVKRIISNSTNGYDNANSTIGDNGYSHVATIAGILYHQAEEYPKLYAVSQAAPIIQALLLLMIYVFLPFTFVFSAYNPSTFVTGAIIIFSIIFWGFIWHLVSWTDNALMQALYNGWFHKQGAGATLADMIIASLVIFSPIFWFVFMGAMGVAAGDIATSLSMGMNKIGGSAASKGASLVGKEAVSATKQAVAVGKAALL
jgi:hypothetical protein